MNKGYKEKLSEHVETIFKKYRQSGLHICDIATGGGKSYTIGKLTCEYYPKHFDRIIILCVQNKLVLGMDKEIEQFINQPTSLISSSDKLVVENNLEVTLRAVQNDSFRYLFEEMNYRINELQILSKDLTYVYNKTRKIYEGLASIIKTYENNRNEYIQGQISDGEASLRKSIRLFFDTYKRHLENIGLQKRLSSEQIHRQFPTLKKIYPQVDFKNKRVLLMTIHKAMYGVDPILTEKINITDFTEKNKRTLILLDESDQAAMAMRSTIIDQAIDNAGGNKRFAKGYNGYLQYRELVASREHISTNYYGTLLEDSLESAQKTIDSNWNRTLENIIPYKNIFLANEEDIEEYRRGVFFSGPTMRLNISRKNDNAFSYVCYKKGNRHLTLAHSENSSNLEKEYDTVVPLGTFLSLIVRSTTTVKTHLRKIVMDMLQKNRDKFNEESKKMGATGNNSSIYMGYPTLEREIHTLFSRFETTSEFMFEQQINGFITNRKNLVLGDDKLKMPDYSVYSQGVQLFQEEVDVRDNQHRVRLSCREILITPEKLLVDLVLSGDNSVVLCSATASSRSVVSNFDISYFFQVLGNKMMDLSLDERNTFDELMEKTYPDGHTVVVHPLEHFEYTDKRDNHQTLPNKYKKMFSKSAQEEGMAELWFRLTKKQLGKSQNEDSSYHMYRLFQFIEAYYWFYTHDDIRSMIYFQNQTGDKNKVQFNVLSSLIDGSYTTMTPFEDELPHDWENKNIRISKDWEEVEGSILKELGDNQKAKIMLISAYGSFKAGANMQYSIPEGLEVLSGDNWETERSAMKKDWDAIYLQSPTAYLMVNEDGNESTSEKSLYNAMLTLMMLYERGCMSKDDVSYWLNMAMSGRFWFSEKNNAGIWKDKAAWAQTIVEQAVGRLCRTRNKSKYTYILYDESMVPMFDSANFDKSLTKEFRVLTNSISERQQNHDIAVSSEEMMRCNNANTAQRQLDRMRSIALRYTVHKDEDIDYEEGVSSEDEVPYNVKISQIMNQSYKQAIIKKPVIDTLTELDDVDKLLTFIGKCYGDWERNDQNEYFFNYDPNKNGIICPAAKGKSYPYPVSPSSVRLDLLMSNDIVREYFEARGYATTWPAGKLILHPRILMTDYAGEIGEEAFKAIIMSCCGVKESDFKHIDGKDYELADFVLVDSKGNYKIAFDVKNMRSQGHDDKPSDMSTTKKRREKLARLNCPLVTVNMLKLAEPTIDALHEIGGVLNEDGSLIPEAIEQLNNFINPTK